VSKLIDYIKEALVKTDLYESKLIDEVLELDAMAGKKTKIFYNNICSIPDARYLEIGLWKGGSFCAAMYNNEMTCLGIDDWSQFGGPRETFLNNYDKYKGINKAQILEKDCWTVPVEEIGKFNIYLYDGEHSLEAHDKALSYYLPCLDDEFIFIVDDWNDQLGIQLTTLQAISDNNLEILYKKDIYTHKEPVIDWYNGMGIFVLKK